MMSSQLKRTIAIAVSSTFLAGVTIGQERDGVSISKTGAATRQMPQNSIASTNDMFTEMRLSEQDKTMIETAVNFADESTKIIEKWLGSHEISEEKLFSFLYYPEANTNPAKFTTDYDAISDRDLQPVLEKYLAAQPDTIFAVVSDRNGYVPTHNLKYSKKLTGDWWQDLVGNRTKRIFADKTGLASARNQKPYLFQRYKRDTGQVMTDLSVPIYIGGRHWGCVRIGYLRTRQFPSATRTDEK
jgi:hypothetical protein